MGREEMTEQTDAEFENKLRSYLAQFSEGHEPAVPLMINTDGTIDREKTLGLACYGDFRPSEALSHVEETQGPSQLLAR
jgi:hypothetical protein